MAENSKIEWTDHTFNAWTGCTKVSAACDFCYAESWAKRSGIVEWGNHPRRRTSASYWKQPLKWNRIAERDGVRRKVFCCSLADVFDNQADFMWRRDLYHLITDTPQLDWLLLTKRPQNIVKMLPSVYGIINPWPWPNVWLGTTVENQEEADRRIPHLLATPAAIRFLSCEPLLGFIDVTAILRRQADGFMRPLDGRFNRLHWVISGGESGPNARPSHPDWHRSLRDQCAAAGVSYFFKQWGEFTDIDHVGDAWNSMSHVARGNQQFLNGTAMIRVGKKAAGALLDGIEHKAMPNV